jgi:hypothetical protein
MSFLKRITKNLIAMDGKFTLTTIPNLKDEIDKIKTLKNKITIGF